MPRWLLVSLISLGIIGIGVGWIRTRPLAIEWQTYTDPDNRFSFGYPNDWSRIGDQDLKNRNEEFVVGFMRSANEPTTAIGVIVRSDVTTTEPADLERELDAKLPDKFQRFQKISARRTVVGKHPALRYEYRYLRHGKTLVRQQQLIVLSDNATHWFVGTALDEHHPQYKQVFNQMLKSVAVQ